MSSECINKKQEIQRSSSITTVPNVLNQVKKDNEINELKNRIKGYKKREKKFKQNHEMQQKLHRIAIQDLSQMYEQLLTKDRIIKTLCNDLRNKELIIKDLEINGSNSSHEEDNACIILQKLVMAQYYEWEDCWIVQCCYPFLSMLSYASVLANKVISKFLRSKFKDI